eukprot:scaffold37425_cov206-Amphora_coffeaeformis.AAC.1
MVRRTTWKSPKDDVSSSTDNHKSWSGPLAYASLHWGCCKRNLPSLAQSFELTFKQAPEFFVEFVVGQGGRVSWENDGIAQQDGVSEAQPKTPGRANEIHQPGNGRTVHFGRHGHPRGPGEPVLYACQIKEFVVNAEEIQVPIVRNVIGHVPHDWTGASKCGDGHLAASIYWTWRTVYVPAPRVEPGHHILSHASQIFGQIGAFTRHDATKQARRLGPIRLAALPHQNSTTLGTSHHGDGNHLFQQVVNAFVFTVYRAQNDKAKVAA